MHLTNELIEIEFLFIDANAEGEHESFSNILENIEWACMWALIIESLGLVSKNANYDNLFTTN